MKDKRWQRTSTSEILSWRAKENGGIIEVGESGEETNFEEDKVNFDCFETGLILKHLDADFQYIFGKITERSRLNIHI